MQNNVACLYSAPNDVIMAFVVFLIDNDITPLIDIITPNDVIMSSGFLAQSFGEDGRA